ncbi:MAG: response regulator, partial [Rhodospirillales bacterium]|nr:response regulator [Rhodospirillales bacterium]
PLKEGAETIAQIKSVYPRLSVLAISGGTRVGANDILENATALGADDTLKKPFSDEAFLEKVSMLLTAGQ